MLYQRKGFVALALVLALLVLALNVEAQPPRRRPPRRPPRRPMFAPPEKTPRHEVGGGGGFMVGMASVARLKSLSEKLQQQGFEEIKQTGLSMGGGGYGIAGRVVLGGWGAGFTQKATKAVANQEAQVSVGYGFFNIGYVLLRSGNLQVFPMLGIGGGGVILQITQKATSYDFDPLLASPNKMVQLSTGGLLLELAMGIHYLLPLSMGLEGVGGILLGLRAGYVYTPSEADWKMSDVEVLGGPDMRPTGPYLCLMIGGAGRGYAPPPWRRR